MESKITPAVLIGLVCAITLNIHPVEGQMCPPVVCETSSLRCPLSTYFTVPSGAVCRGCNMCLQPGSPTDSIGCPLMACNGPFPKNMCKDPRYNNSWLNFGGRKCPTCWATICKMTSP